MNSLLRVLLISLIAGAQTLAQENNTQDAIEVEVPTLDANVTAVPKLNVNGTDISSNNTVALNATSIPQINSNSTVELPVNSTAEVSSDSANQVPIASKQSTVPEEPKTEEPKSEEPKSKNSSVPEEPKAEEPKSKDSSVPEEPKPEEPKSKDSRVPEEPIVEEPKTTPSESIVEDVPTPSEPITDDVPVPSESVVVDIPVPSQSIVENVPAPSSVPTVEEFTTPNVPATPACLTGCVDIPTWTPTYCDILECPLPPQFPTCVFGSCPIPSFVPSCNAGPCVSPFVSFFPDVDVTTVISTGTSFEEQLLKLISTECTTLKTLPVNESRIKLIANFKKMMESFELLSSQVSTIQNLFVSAPYEKIVNVLVTPEYAGLCQTLGLTQSSLASYSASSLQSVFSGFQSSIQTSTHAAFREYESYSSSFGIASSELKSFAHSINLF